MDHLTKKKVDDFLERYAIPVLGALSGLVAFWLTIRNAPAIIFLFFLVLIILPFMGVIYQIGIRRGFRQALARQEILDPGDDPWSPFWTGPRWNPLYEDPPQKSKE